MVSLVKNLIIVLIVFLLGLGLLLLARDAFLGKSLEQFKRFKVYKPYIFNVNDLLVDPNDPDVFDAGELSNYLSTTFCSDLKNCLEVNARGGEKCVISYKVEPNVDLDPDDIRIAINNCPTEDIKEELYGGIGRKVCGFKSDSLNPNIDRIREDNITIVDYQPYLHNCYLPESLGTKNIFDEKDKIYYFYSGRGDVSGYDFENGGIVRIVITNVSVVGLYADCSYSVYVCGQNAIAESEDETPVDVFRTVQNLPEEELYYNETVIWKGDTPQDFLQISLWWLLCKPFELIVPFLDCGDLPNPINYNIYGYHPRTYEFTFNSSGCLSRGTCREALIDAADAGIWEWGKKNYKKDKTMKYFRDSYYPDIMRNYFSYSPIDINNISYDSAIAFGSGCWNVNYENTNTVYRQRLIFGDDVFIDSNSLYHIFNFSSPFNLNANEKLRMSLGIKKIFITGKMYHILIEMPPLIILDKESSRLKDVKDTYNLRDDFESRTILVMDPITFCSE